MRILKNIYNEFAIYYNRLNTIELNCNKMLGMIAYKNIFPKDFSELQLNQGMVYTLFAKKNVFIQDEMELLDASIKENEEAMDRSEKEHMESIRELDDAYEAKYSRITGGYQQGREIRERYDKELEKRKEAIKLRAEHQLEDLKKEVDGIKKERVDIRNKPLQYIINRKNIDEIFKITSENEIGKKRDFNEIKGSEYFLLLKYLIREGHIDESYADYMTYFYENSLSRTDKRFLRSITDQKAKEYSYGLENPKLIMGRIGLANFNQEEVLNFDLLHYLLKEQINSEPLEHFMLQLKNSRNMKFIGSFLDTGKAQEAYVKALNKNWPELFSYALGRGGLSDQQLRDYSTYTLYYSDSNTIQKVNNGDNLKNYISTSADYLNIAFLTDEKEQKVIEGFNLLKVSFEKIDAKSANPSLLERVYEANTYEINYENIKLMLQIFNDVDVIKDSEAVKHKNYTLVSQNPNSALTEYVEEEIEKYMVMILDNSAGQICDDEEKCLKIINNDSISEDSLNEYIKQLSTKISDLRELVDLGCYNKLLKANLVEYSTENIIEYFIENGMDEDLVKFINRKEAKINIGGILNEQDEGLTKRFWDSIVACDDLDNDVYREIVHSLVYICKDFDAYSISEEKVAIIVGEEAVEMNLGNLLFIREHYPKQVMRYIGININEYIKIISEESFIFDELLVILEMRVEDDIKTELLAFTQQPISVLRRRYSATVNKYILRNNFEIADLPELCQNYEDWDDDSKEIILDKAIVFRRNIEPNEISVKLLRDMFISKRIDASSKIKIFERWLQDSAEETCKEFLDILGLQEYKKIFKPRSRPKFKINGINKDLLTAFKKAGIIYGFEKAGESSAFYKIRRNRPKKDFPIEML